MPTAAQIRFSNNARLDPMIDDKNALMTDVNIGASATIAKGTVVGELTATPGTFKAYASGNADGSQIPKGLMVYSVTSDASGNISLMGEYGQTRKECPVYFSGTFRTAEITGLDAGALTTMGGTLISGTLASGIVRFG